MAKSEPPRLAILGAGPVGLEAGLYAHKLKLPFALYERGQPGDHLRRWGHARLFSPFAMNVTPLGRQLLISAGRGEMMPADDAYLTGREHVEQYLTPLADVLKASLKTETRVVSVARRGFLKGELLGDPARARQPFLLLVRDKAGERVEEADVVLDCTGTYGQHRWLGPGGMPAVGELAAEAGIGYWLDDLTGDRRKDFAGRSILVVGAGYSAASTVCNLAAIADADNATWITWVARAALSQPLRRIPNDPLRERDRLAQRANNFATRTDDNVEFHAQTVIDAVEALGPDKGFRVQARKAGVKKTWEVDRLIANVGYTPDTALYRELQVQECPATLAPLKVPEPNFHVLGAKSQGRGGQFLLGQGFAQVREAFVRITGNAKLDLYAPK